MERILHLADRCKVDAGGLLSMAREAAGDDTLRCVQELTAQGSLELEGDLEVLAGVAA